jgi:hypothetical protein
MTEGDPPTTSARWSFPAAKKPIVRLSGTQKGKVAPSEEQLQFADLPNKVEARWRPVEPAWELDLPSSLIVACDPEQDSLTRQD